MKSFKDLAINSTNTNFVGDKISIDRIVNREIIVHDYKIENSKFERGSGKCLCLQITLADTKHIIFTGSVVLMNAIEQVAKEDFPFKTTIVKDVKRFDFT